MRFVKSGVQALAVIVGLFVGSIVLANAAGLSLFTGPAGTNPAVRPDIIPDLNTLIQNINSNLATYLTMAPTSAEVGEMAFGSSQAFAPNGSVATSITSVGPVGSHTTVQNWLLVIRADGTVGYIPVF